MLIDIVSDVLFPIECLSCHQEQRAWLCQACKEDFLSSEPGRAARSLDVGPGPLDGCYCLFDYSHPTAGTLIRSYKYQFVHGVRDQIEELAAGRCYHVKKAIGNAVVVPIPLHKKRKRARGYNQADCLAKSLAKSAGLAMEEGLLQRKRYTSAQARLNRQERLQNTKSAFGLRKGAKVGGKYVLVDDVVTTGATMKGAAQALKDAGASQVFGVAFAGQDYSAEREGFEPSVPRKSETTA